MSRTSWRLSRITWPAMLCLAVIVSAVVMIVVLRANHAGDDVDARPTTVADVVAASAASWQARLPLQFGAITELTAVESDGRALNFYYRIADPNVFARIDFADFARRTITVICRSASDISLLQQGAAYHYWFTNGVAPHQRKYTIARDNCVDVAAAPSRQRQ